MNEDPTNNSDTIKSRRTGIDRRWIPSADHQPERRRCGDRRTSRKQSWAEPMAKHESEEGRPPFPEILPDAKPPVVDLSAVTQTKK